MRLQIHHTPETETLTLSGELGLYEAEAARDALLDRMTHWPTLTLDLTRVEVCDTAGLQLLVAARRMAAASEKELIIRSSPALEECSSRLGISPEIWKTPAQ